MRLYFKSLAEALCGSPNAVCLASPLETERRTLPLRLASSSWDDRKTFSLPFPAFPLNGSAPSSENIQRLKAVFAPATPGLLHFRLLQNRHARRFPKHTSLLTAFGNGESPVQSGSGIALRRCLHKTPSSIWIIIGARDFIQMPAHSGGILFRFVSFKNRVCPEAESQASRRLRAEHLKGALVSFIASKDSACFERRNDVSSSSLAVPFIPRLRPSPQ